MADSEQNVAPPVAGSEPASNTNGAPANPDVEMADSVQLQEPATNPTLQPTVQTAPPTPAPQPVAASAPSLPAPSSSRNSPHPAPQAPTHPIPHGSPTRVYLNQNVTPYLLEAMKHLATNEPEKPLKWLSEFLATKSAEIEG